MNDSSIKQDNKQHWVYVVFTIFFIITGLLFAVLNLFEFYIVGFTKNTSEYSFGEINENPWYYRTADSYSNYMLVYGLILLGLSIFTSLGLCKKKYLCSVLSTGMLAFLLAYSMAGG